MTDDPLDPSLEQEIALVEVLNRVLDRGAVISGEVTISIAGIDLVELGLHVYLASALTAERTGLSAFPSGRRPSRAPLPSPEE